MACRLASVAATALLFTLVAFRGCEASEIQQQDLARLMMERPWLYHYLMRSRWARPLDHDMESPLSPQPDPELNADNSLDDDDRDRADKRSAIATALNSGRRRRQPTPALGKDVTQPYVGVVGVLNDVGSFFDSLRDNLETLAALSPQQRASLLLEPPTVVNANSHGVGGGSGSGIRRLHALRPLRPTGNIRTYNRRSLLDSDMYAGANHHDPGLLWAGLGR